MVYIEQITFSFGFELKKKNKEINIFLSAYTNNNIVAK